MGVQVLQPSTSIQTGRNFYLERRKNGPVTDKIT